MRLTELNRKPLTAFQNEPLPDMMTVRDFMLKYGFKQLGKSGNWGRVFEHPELNYVLKVFKRDDIGYISFLKFALRNPSPYLPKFRGKLVHINNDFSAVRMEKLEEYDERPLRGFSWKDLYLYLTAEMGNIEYNASGLAAEMGNIEYNTTGYTTRDNVIDRIEAALPGLTAVLDEIADLGLSVGALGDLQTQNMMWRGNQLVITDPLWKAGGWRQTSQVLI